MRAVAPENACVTIDDDLIESGRRVRVEVTRCPSAPQSSSDGRWRDEVVCMVVKWSGGFGSGLNLVGRVVACMIVRESGGLGGGWHWGGVLALNKNPDDRTARRSTSCQLQ